MSGTILKRATLVIVIISTFTIIGFWVSDQFDPHYVDALKEYKFSFEFDAPLPEALGEPFLVQTDNCNSPASTVETFRRKRDFSIQANWQITEAVLESISRQFGTELTATEIAGLKADIERVLAEQLEASNGIDVGYIETFEAERQITTPPDSKSTVWLQWEEIRYLGLVEILDPYGVFIDKATFYVVRDLRLSQIRVQVEPCQATPENPTTVSATPESSSPPDSLQAIRLVAPVYSIYQNPISFSWDGSDETLYQVSLIHREKGYKHTSDWIQGFIWIYQLPSEQYGNWDWYVTTTDGTTSDIWNFVFDPFPGTKNSDGNDQLPAPTTAPTSIPFEPTLQPTAYP